MTGWVPDSRTPGYLGPQPSPQAPQDDAWEDLLHDMIAGITGLDPTLVRPRWQPEPPNIPDFNVDWVAFGITDTELAFQPSVIHVDDGGDGYDYLSDQETDVVLCTFYGPNAEQYASYLRRGLYVWQNRAMLRANAAGLVEVTTLKRAPEFIKNMWLQRVDLNVIIRREVQYNYAVYDLLRAAGPITAVDFAGNVHTAEYDTDLVIPPP